MRSTWVALHEEGWGVLKEGGCALPDSGGVLVEGGGEAGANTQVDGQVLGGATHLGRLN